MKLVDENYKPDDDVFCNYKAVYYDGDKYIRIIDLVTLLDKIGKDYSCDKIYIKALKTILRGRI